MDILKFAEEAGFRPRLPRWSVPNKIYPDSCPNSMEITEKLERFANLVAAAARAEERESVITWISDNYQNHSNLASLLDAIRSRSDEASKEQQ